MSLNIHTELDQIRKELGLEHLPTNLVLIRLALHIQQTEG